MALWLACLGVGAAMLCNPWGVDLLRWLVGSVLWLRPEIEEWNPTPLNADHIAFFILLAVAAAGWALTQKRRAAWELAACLAFAVLAVRSVRNTPLCSIVILALVPRHFASAAARLEAHLARSLAFFRRTGSQRALAGVFGLAMLGCGSATFILHKEHPLTIEVSRGLYPVSALEFMRQHDLSGNLLVFFDWGDLCIWQLPSCRVSIDGRLDACYSRELIAEHWKLYNGQTVNSHRLDLDQADLALLPANFAGAFALAKRPGWQPVYYDDLAVVLVRAADRFAKLRESRLPIQGPSSATLGAEPLPGANSPRSQR